MVQGAQAGMMDRFQLTDRALGAGLVLLVLAGCFVVLRPFLSAILWACILTFSTWPLFLRLKLLLGDRPALSALVMTIAMAALLVVPLVTVLAGLAENGVFLVNAANRMLSEGLPDPPAWLRDLPLIGSGADAYWRGLAHDGVALIAEAQRLLPATRRALLGLGELMGAGLVQLGLSVFLAFFLYRNGDAVAAQLNRASARIAGDRAQRLLEVAGGTVISVVYGILGTALAQGLLAGIGLYLAGVPAAPLLGLLTFFLSIVPVGPPLVWVPATLWLFFEGQVGWAIFLAVWGFFVISGVDNVIKPWLISRGSRLPFAMTLLGVLGGVLAFGFIGVFLGPTLLAIGYRLLAEWNLDAVQSRPE
jgi:predicted PurR-regulated permease PerM